MPIAKPKTFFTFLEYKIPGPRPGKRSAGLGPGWHGELPEE